jgi:hypothetical protein
MTQEWQWQPAHGQDVTDIVTMAVSGFESEVDGIFCPDHTAYARNVTQAIVTQFYNPHAELLLVARNTLGALVAYVWVIRETAPWSDEVMAAVRMAHVDLALSAGKRIRLIEQMIGFWEVWAQESGIPIICSTTMRRDTQGFLRLHQRRGYDVRGSIAYKRLK